MSILKSEIDLKGTKPNYLRTTKNLYSHFVNGRQLFFSYYTLIAIDDLISVNNWSVTTGRHLFWINPDKDIRVEDFDEQAREILEKDNLISTYDHLNSVSSVSAIFSIMANDETEEQVRKTNEQRKRFYETVNGISFPDDWDNLSTKDQKKRLDLTDYIGLDKADEVLNG
jgi:hypothetical protein|tara:strand:- start:43 stop:552 length:510 start_codon:yes stop_codon:yes gene_type:complete